MRGFPVGPTYVGFDLTAEVPTDGRRDIAELSERLAASLPQPLIGSTAERIPIIGTALGMDITPCCRSFAFFSLSIDQCDSDRNKKIFT